MSERINSNTCQLACYRALLTNIWWYRMLLDHCLRHQLVMEMSILVLSHSLPYHDTTMTMTCSLMMVMTMMVLVCYCYYCYCSTTPTLLSRCVIVHCSIHHMVLAERYYMLTHVAIEYHLIGSVASL
jgi:hypothetical protein